MLTENICNKPVRLGDTAREILVIITKYLYVNNTYSKIS